MSKMPDPESVERFWAANSPPCDQGDPPSLRWTRPLPEESSHNALDMVPHPFWYSEYRHKINGNDRQYGLQENQTTTVGEKPSLPSSKAGLNPSVKGSPRYRMGNEVMGVDSTATTRANSSESKPMPTTEDLLLFSCRPEKSENMSNMVETWCAAIIDPRMKKVVSSAYCNNGIPPDQPVVWSPVR